jgi:DNA-directed RNA polymerase
LQFLAFCLSYRKYKNDPNCIINLPIFLDATCSGVQHLAAMLQDVNIAKEVNLLESTDSKDVEDIYSTVAEYINKTINQNKNNKKFKDIKLTRKILKTSIMTQVYNVKVSGIFNQLKSKLEIVEKLNKKTNKTTKFYLAPTKNGKHVELSYIEVYDIATIISKGIFEIYPPLREIYDYFINMIKLMLKLNIPIV